MQSEKTFVGKNQLATKIKITRNLSFGRVQRLIKRVLNSSDTFAVHNLGSDLHRKISTEVPVSNTDF